MNCPHCGSDWKGWRGMFDCDSYPSGKEGNVKRTECCYERQISQLKAELAQSVRMGDPRLKEIIEHLEFGFHALAIEELQSIIEGK